MPPKRQALQRTYNATEKNSTNATIALTSTKKKTDSPQKQGTTLPSGAATRNTRARNVDATNEASSAQTAQTTSPVPVSPGGAEKMKRGRPRKRTTEPEEAETNVTLAVADVVSQIQHESSAVPPKKRKGIRMVECQPVADQEKEKTPNDQQATSENVKNVKEDLETSVEESGDHGDEDEDVGIQPLEIETEAGDAVDDEEGEKEGTKEGDGTETTPQATPSQKANIKTQQKRSGTESPPLPSNILQCPVCSAYCVQLVRHIRTHHGDHQDIQAKIKEARAMEQKVQPKEVPGQKIGTSKAPRKQQLVRPKNVQCPLCLKVVRRYDFNKHVRNVHSGEKPHKCPHCDYCTPWKGNLNTHIQGVHTKERAHSCPSCTLAFKTRGALIGHVRKIHEGMYAIKERPFECSTCHKMFFKKYHLERHVRIHTGERPYNCVFCEKKFSSKTNLDTHVQSVHLKIKPFKCGYCEKGFLRKKQLVDHIQSHHLNPGTRKATARAKKKVEVAQSADNEHQTILLVREDGANAMNNANELMNAAAESQASSSHEPSPVLKGDSSQTIIWRVQLPDGSQELHIRTCESEQTPQVLLIPQNQPTGSGEGDVIVLQPVQAKASDIKVKPTTSQSLRQIQPAGGEPVMTLSQASVTPSVIGSQSIINAAPQTLISPTELPTHTELSDSHPISAIIPSETEIIVSEQQAVDQTDGADAIQAIANAANLHIIQEQDSNEAMTISVLSPDQPNAGGNGDVPVMLPSTSQVLSAHMIDVAHSDQSVVSLVDGQAPASQEYFYQSLPSAWQPIYNQSGQGFQTFQTSNGSYQFDVNTNQTFPSSSVQNQFSTFPGNGQAFTPIEPQPCGDLPQNFNVHSMEKTYQIVVSQPQDFHENLPGDTVSVTDVQDESQSQQGYF